MPNHPVLMGDSALTEWWAHSFVTAQTDGQGQLVVQVLRTKKQLTITHMF